MPSLLVACFSVFCLGAARGQTYDLPYAGYHPSLLFDWFPPTSTTDVTPLLVYLHGGHAGPGDKANLSAAHGYRLELLRGNEITVMAINFRPYPDFIYPAQLEDAAVALQYFQENALLFNIDPDRIVLWGDSGGAIIAGWLTYGEDFGDPLGSPQEQHSTRPLGFMNHAGLTNFMLMHPAFPADFLGYPTLGDVDQLFLESISISEMVIDYPRPFTPPTASFYGDVENPPPLINPHDATLMFDLHQKLETFPEVHAESLMLQRFTGVPDKHVETIVFWGMKVLGIDHQLNLGQALAGTADVFPEFVATGQWSPGGTITLSMKAALPAPLSLFLVVSPFELGAHFKGGVLVPHPSVILPLASDPHGGLILQDVLPSTLSAGNIFYMQFWHEDPGGRAGYAASNAIKVMVE